MDKGKIVVVGIALVICFGVVGFVLLSQGEYEAHVLQNEPIPTLSPSPTAPMAPSPLPDAISSPAPASVPVTTPSPSPTPLPVSSPSFSLPPYVGDIITEMGNFAAEGVLLTVVMPPSYTDIELRGNYVSVRVDGLEGLFCVVTMTEVVPPLFGWVRQFYDGLAHVRFAHGGNLWGIVDGDGDVVVDFVSNVAFFMNYGRGVVRWEDKWGAIDFAGNIFVPLEFDRAGRLFFAGLLNVARRYAGDLKWGFVDVYGREVVPLMYEWAAPFVNRFARVRYGGKMGLINTAGEVVIPFEHLDIMPMGCGTAMFMVGENRHERMFGIIDLSDGRVIVPPIYGMGWVFDFEDEHFPHQLFFEGLAALERDGKWGFVNMEGEEVIPFMFEFVTNFRDGFSFVGYEREMGLINTYGEMIIPFGEFASISLLPNGLARVMVNGQRGWSYGIIEIATGREIVSPFYSEIIQRDGWFAVQYGGRADGLWGLLDDNGREVIPPMYTYLGTFMDGLALVSIGGDRIFYATGELCGYMMPVGGQWLLIDKENNVVAAFQYSAMQRVSHNLLAFSESVIYRTNPHLPTDRRVQSAEWGFIAIEFDAPSFLE